MPGKRLNSRAQEFVINLLEYFEMEKNNGGPFQPISSVQERVATALKISVKTVCSLKKKNENIPTFPTSPSQTPRLKLKTEDLPEGTKMAVRNTLYNMYEQRKHVTVKTINEELKNKEILSIGNTSLLVLLKHLGFKYKKEDNRRALIEQTNIASQRACFLRKYRENRDSAFSRQIIFLDETWIYAKGTKSTSWQDSNVKSVRKPGGYDGKRYIIVHAGSSKGFVEDASLVFSSKSSSSDYHGEMDGEIFTKWVSTQLIPNLEEPSLIVMDNAPYHSILAEKQPSTSSKKYEIITWLKANNLVFNENLSRPELLQIAKMNRKENVYVIDELFRMHGHEVLRLPPYHCEFNAIELIWAHCNTYYNKYIGRDGYGDEKVLSMWKEALENCSANVCDNCVRHTEKIIEDWFTRDKNLVGMHIEPVIVNTGEDSSDSVTDEF